MKTARRTDGAGKRSGLCLLFAALISLTGPALPSWAGQWLQNQEGGWLYQEDGVSLTGWQNIDGWWYYLDPETGLWQENPSITAQGACCLLENRLKELNLYQDEDRETSCRLEEEKKNSYRVSVGYYEKPDVWRSLNFFEVDPRTGVAKSESGRWEVELL